LEFSALSNEYNLKRIVYICVSIIALEIFNLFDPGCSVDRLLPGITALLVLSALYILIILTQYKRLLSTGLCVYITIAFWPLLTLALTPFYLLDISNNGIPFHVLTYCALLIVVPVFSPRQSLGMIALVLVQNLLLAAHTNAPPAYIKFCLLICVGAFVLTLLTRQQYVRMILSLLKENRLDPLTGILNRRAGLGDMEALVEISARHGSTVAAFMVDIDLFKAYNDVHGHLVADAVLRRIAMVLNSAFERRTDIFFRYGGEEFLACCSIRDKSDAAALAYKLCRAVENAAIPAADRRVAEHLSVSIGYTVYTPTPTAPQTKNHYTMIWEADQALYSAKSQGRNRTVCYAPDTSPGATQ
jgi:diguanylate cyclase (GGDEF)-like protein